MKTIHRISLLAAATVAAVSATAFAATSFTVQEANQLIGKVSHQTAKAVSVFPGPDGMHGILVRPKVITPNMPPALQKGQIAWASPNGKNLLMGPLVGMNGTNYTVKAMYANHIIPKPVSAALLWKKAKQSDSFVVGTKGPLITAIFDPNCIFCHLFYEKAMPYVNKHELRIRFVIAGFLKPTSRRKAETILSSKNPAGELAYDETHFLVHVEEGGVPPDQHPSAKVVAAVNANTHLLAETGEVATPTLLIRETHGHYRLIRGLPRDFDAFIHGILHP